MLNVKEEKEKRKCQNFSRVAHAKVSVPGQTLQNTMNQIMYLQTAYEMRRGVCACVCVCVCVCVGERERS